MRTLELLGMRANVSTSLHKYELQLLLSSSKCIYIKTDIKLLSLNLDATGRRSKKIHTHNNASSH